MNKTSVQSAVERAANEGLRIDKIDMRGRTKLADIQINNASSVDPSALGNSIRALALAVGGREAAAHVHKQAAALTIEVFSAPDVSGQ